MPKGVYQRKPMGAAFEPPFSIPQTGVEPVAVATLNEPTAAPKLVAMELKRNYRPMGTYEIVGHTKPARVVKDAAGKEIIAQAEEFIEGEAFPHPFGSTGFVDKMIAGTLIRVPVDEAERMKKLGIAERALRD